MVRNQMSTYPVRAQKWKNKKQTVDKRNITVEMVLCKVLGKEQPKEDIYRLLRIFKWNIKFNFMEL